MGGSLLVVQSILWEFVRMQPDNNYLVDPWSYRGLESIHGIVFATIGLALFAASFVVAQKATQEPRVSLSVVGGIALIAFVIALIFAGDEDLTLAGDSLGGMVFGLALGYALYLGAQRFSEKSLGSDAGITTVLKGGTGSIIMFVFLAIGFLLIQAILGSGRTMAVPVGVLIMMVLVGALMALTREPSMAANRMLITTSVIAGTAIGMSGAALRSTLVRFQGEGGSIPGEYRDTQVTWGYFLANIGIVLVFIGAVMLWARRRDIVQSQARAAKQRAAAEESAKELAAAG